MTEKQSPGYSTEMAVVHDKGRKEFSLAVEGSNSKAVLQYCVLPSGVWNLYHTEVPEECRGQGLGAKLAKVRHTHNTHTVLNMHVG